MEYINFIPVSVMAFKHNIFLIPPVFLFLSVILIGLFYFIIPEYNIIPFPYNFSGVVLIIAGLVITGRTYEQFRKYKTTFYIGESSYVMTTGIYSYSRNPMYCGMVCVLSGVAVCFMNYFSLSVPLLFWAYINFIIIPREEKLMFDKFGGQYLIYKRKVRKWI